MSTDGPLTFECSDNNPNGTCIFRLVGPLTLRNVFAIQAALRPDPLPKVLVVDLSQVPYMDSAGMGVIVNAYVHCRNHGTEFIAVGVCDRVKALFELTRVDKLIPIRETAEGL
jgi:anti-sigma B factor antagonist